MTEEQIHKICKEYGIENYTINDDMSIDIDDNVDLWSKNLYKLPLRFRKISGYFSCSSNKLTTLEGSPIEVGNYFHCVNNKLTSLKGGPIKVGGNFWCHYNKLTSLENGPKFIGANLYCHKNPIYEEFKNKFNCDYNLYRKYIHRQKILKGILND